MADGKIEDRTIIGRAAGPGGEGLQVVLGDCDPAGLDEEQFREGVLIGGYRKMFGRDPVEVVVVEVPYLHHTDGNGDED